MSTATATAPGAIDQETHHKNAWVKVLPVIGIVLIVVYCLAPFYWMVVSSLRPDNEIFDNTWWPAHPSLENYQAVFQPNNNFLRGLGNSLIVSISVTIIALLIATFASYALARLDFRGKGGFLILIIATSMFPLVAIIVPLLKN
ncbi:MAG: carbohydrate ABC transporter permease, partial [Cutibacterium avidum]|nr:carbohydrate ABC transporter permease [Cutibacterium avidum]